MRTLALLSATLLAGPLPAAAQDTPGDFEYYVLSLSWSPSWCAAEDDGTADQCRPGVRRGFVVHGLWPQYEQGWPSDCRTEARDPTRGDSAEMADLMGSGGLAWYQWKKHGRCSGLSGRDYYSLMREAVSRVAIPPAYARLPRDLNVPPGAIEAAFLAVNPDMTREGVTITCDAGAVEEVRICLTRDLRPRDCAPDARRDCGARVLRMPQVE
ncbi:ribonuclease T [Paracoccus suum]|uniref:Ribonuclease T n=1 Tax=Paracoccus suum TaxID=2259340 RepID=A0A344PNX5_9RHOB|nr:ribonuclease T2 [Paracoccus suum]AXC51080.1 ribonuclease T [Paracoccus suum]